MLVESMFHDTMFFKAIFFSFFFSSVASMRKRGETFEDGERERDRESRRCVGIGARDNEKEDRVRRP